MSTSSTMTASDFVRLCVEASWPKLSERSRAVLRLVQERPGITQRKIADQLPQIGPHLFDPQVSGRTTERAVRAIVRDLRFEGVPVLSNIEGYRLPTTFDELEGFISEFVNVSLSRSLGSLATARTLASRCGATCKELDAAAAVLEWALKDHSDPAEKDRIAEQIIQLVSSTDEFLEKSIDDNSDLE